MKLLIIKTYPAAMFIVAAIMGLASCNGGNTSGGSKKALLTSAVAQDTISNALPFTVEFVEQNYSGNPLPRLQSYRAAAIANGYLVVMGGRRQGLHTFEGAPANNFIKDSANNFIYVINPATGQYWSFDVNTLPDKVMAASLQATNQQSYYDRATGLFYLLGGYGWKPDGSDMTTFNTLMKINLEALAALIMNNATPDQVQGVIKMAQDPQNRFAVNAGELFKLGRTFYLVFGQDFEGQYRAFGGSDFTQTYTEKVSEFTLDTNSLSILVYGASTSSDSDHPYHRRDGNIITDIDPATGTQRIAAFGGVFQPGIIAPYTYPVYISSPSPVIDRSGQQKFSQYMCPVINIYDSGALSATHHVFYGGIGHYYYSQTDSQRIAFDTVTAQGRNDGFPFVEDVSVFSQNAQGAYNEFILPAPITNNRLLGASASFIVNPALAASGQLAGDNTIRLQNIAPGTKVLAGYIYGGIEAQNPLPLIPNSGTFVSNSVFAVYVTNAPSAAIPASKAKESVIHNDNIQRK